MNNVKTYIDSGVLEMYVMGLTSATENEDVVLMTNLHPLIRSEIEKISNALHSYLTQLSIQPPAGVKHSLLELIGKAY